MTLKKGTIISIHELLRLPATPLSLWLSDSFAYG